MAKTVRVKLANPKGPPYRSPNFEFAIKGDAVMNVELTQDIRAKIKGGKLVMADDDEETKDNEIAQELPRRWVPAIPAWKVEKEKEKKRRMAADEKRKQAAMNRRAGQIAEAKKKRGQLPVPVELEAAKAEVVTTTTQVAEVAEVADVEVVEATPTSSTPSPSTRRPSAPSSSSSAHKTGLAHTPGTKTAIMGGSAAGMTRTASPSVKLGGPSGPGKKGGK